MQVFKNFNLDVAAGQSVALVGESGSGKSTAIQLLQRFYDPAAGVVSVDGHDIRTLQLEWLRGQIGLVSQEPTLFATTIRGVHLPSQNSGATNYVSLCCAVGTVLANAVLSFPNMKVALVRVCSGRISVERIALSLHLRP
jgi:ABC-type transport system involved in cytochrome bd biosynthesis fused ATPase/permease subunit